MKYLSIKETNTKQQQHEESVNNRFHKFKGARFLSSSKLENWNSFATKKCFSFFQPFFLDRKFNLLLLLLPQSLYSCRYNFFWFVFFSRHQRLKNKNIFFLNFSPFHQRNYVYFDIMVIILTLHFFIVSFKMAAKKIFKIVAKM